MRKAESSLPFACCLPPSVLSRFNKAEVSVRAAVQHANSVGLGVAEHNELIVGVGQYYRGLFGCHRLYAVAALSHYSRRVRCCFDCAAGHRRYFPGGLAPALLCVELLFKPQTLLLNSACRRGNRL